MICSLQTDSEDASSYSLTRINVETGEETEITKTAARSLFLKRSPGGRYMVYSDYPFGFATMLVDLETNEIIRTFTTESEDGRGVFTPDGGSMIYLKYYDFESTSIKVGHATMICSQPIDPAARFASGITGMPVEIPADYGILPEFGAQVSDKDVSFQVIGAPLWTPDGESIFFTDSSGKIWSVPVDGGEETLVYDNPAVVYKDYPVNIQQVKLYGFTPDCSEILFSRNAIDEERGSTPELRYAGDRIVGVKWSNGLSYLYAVNVETGAVRTVIVGGEYGVYSPDGRYLAYTVNEFKGVTGDAFLDEHRHQIIVRNLETGEETFIPITVYQRFYWTADSSALFMHSSPTEFCRVPIDGSEPEVYQAKTGYLYSLDSARPFLVLHERGVLYGVNYLTGERTRITPDVDGEFSYPVLSPDGTKLTCVVTYEGASLLNPYQTMSRRQLFVIDIDSASLIPTEVEDVAPAPELVIGNYPNPFNPTTAIIFSLPGDGITQLDIYNLSGQKVRELVYGRMNKGVHIVSWDGHTTDGSQAASGIYIARISIGNHIATRRMTLMK